MEQRQAAHHDRGGLSVEATVGRGGAKTSGPWCILGKGKGSAVEGCRGAFENATIHYVACSLTPLRPDKNHETYISSHLSNRHAYCFL